MITKRPLGLFVDYIKGTFTANSLQDKALASDYISIFVPKHN